MSFRRWQKLIANRISNTVFDPLSSEASSCVVLTPPSVPPSNEVIRLPF
jgi:hypothetical protein